MFFGPLAHKFQKIHPQLYGHKIIFNAFQLSWHPNESIDAKYDSTIGVLEHGTLKTWRRSRNQNWGISWKGYLTG